MKIRHPMTLRHPVPKTGNACLAVYGHAGDGWGVV